MMQNSRITIPTDRHQALMYWAIFKWYGELYVQIYKQMSHLDPLFHRATAASARNSFQHAILIILHAAMIQRS